MSDPITLPLASDCSLRTVKPLQADLITALAGGEVVVLDCARVERADIAFVQLVLAASGTAERSGKRIGLSNMPAPVAAAFQRAGVAAPLLTPS
ncbi:STAS domain-containing protein [Methylorubrum populi]